MSIQENKAVVRRFVQEVQNQRNLDVVDELVHPDFVDHSGPPEAQGIEGVKASHKMLFSAFPDLNVTIQQQLAEDDQVLTYKTFHGTHLGAFMGIPATGRQISFDLMDIMTVHDSKIAEHWKVADFLSLMQQLGAMPAPIAQP